MLSFSFFKTKRPKSFDFNPRFYDPVREDLDKRKARIELELNGKSDVSTEHRIRGSFRTAAVESKKKQASAFARYMFIISTSICGYIYWIYDNETCLYLSVALFTGYIIAKVKRIF